MFDTHLRGTIRWRTKAEGGLAAPPDGEFFRATAVTKHLFDDKYDLSEHLSVVLRLPLCGRGEPVSEVEIAYLAPELADLDPDPGSGLVIFAGSSVIAEVDDVRPEGFNGA